MPSPSLPKTRTRPISSRPRVNNRERGKRGERDARDAVRKHWRATSCIRAGQANGAYSADLLHCDPKDVLHVEVKLRRRLSVSSFIAQAVRDCKDAVPVVLMREDGGDWLVMLRCSDTERFVNAIHQQLHSA